ncbi:hypothetical protein DFAR_910007 [Desulfarculales bacterium]
MPSRQALGYIPNLLIGQAGQGLGVKPSPALPMSILINLCPVPMYCVSRIAKHSRVKVKMSCAEATKFYNPRTGFFQAGGAQATA